MVAAVNPPIVNPAHVQSYIHARVPHSDQHHAALQVDGGKEHVFPMGLLYHTYDMTADKLAQVGASPFNMIMPYPGPGWCGPFSCF